MSLTKEGMKATLRRLYEQPVGALQIHGRRIMVAAPDLADVFLDHLKEREAIARQELKNIEYVRANFLAGHRAMVSARLKLKHGR
jgi:hypothetical protein